MNKPELIVMLTYHDRTAENACEVFLQCKQSKAKYWGFKEEGLPLEKMKELFALIKTCGKTTVLEVVAYTESECLAGAKMAAECQCDILMGTVFFDSVMDFCKAHSIKYMPYIGRVSGRPSVLEGTVEEMVSEAEEYLAKGVYGFDLLGYRHSEDPARLNKDFVRRVHAPVCLAGSVNSLERLDEVKEAAPWAFTIGSAFFDGAFGGTFCEQIDKVCEYMEK